MKALRVDEMNQRVYLGSDIFKALHAIGCVCVLKFKEQSAKEWLDT